MGHRRPKRHHLATKSHTLPSSPTHSSSSSDFEFTISASRISSSGASAADLCPADDLFYKGQLLPLHLSPRRTMVRTLLLSSISISSSDTTTTASRDSSADDSGYSSGRPSSVADDLEVKRLKIKNPIRSKPTSKHYFSLPKLFRKEQSKPAPPPSGGGAAANRAKEMILKYMKKVKPFYEKLSQKQKMSSPAPARIFRSAINKIQELNYPKKEKCGRASVLHSFSGNLRLYYPRARSNISSCPSSMRSSPSRCRSGSGYGNGFSQMGPAGMYNSDASSIEELHNAVRGAIAHCKDSMLQNKAMVGRSGEA